jgi:RHS repeat-associated protein
MPRQRREPCYESTGASSYATGSGAWYDGIGRVVATANFGHEKTTDSVNYFFDVNGELIDEIDAQGNSVPDGVPDVVQMVRFDNVIETTAEDEDSEAGIDFQLQLTDYNAAGRAYKVTDNIGRENWTLYDAAGRTVRTIQNYDESDNGAVAETDTDRDYTTEYQYDAGGRLITMIAYNPKGSGKDIEDQVTAYLYESPINAGWQTDVVYPDSTSGQDLESLEQTSGEATATLTDHNFSVGDWVYIVVANEAQYNGRVQITGINTDTFSYAVSADAPSAATGTMRVYSTDGRDVKLARTSSTTATATVANHGFSVNDWVYIVGAADLGCNGRFQITAVTTDTFSYTVPSGAVVSIAGAIRVFKGADRVSTVYDRLGRKTGTLEQRGVVHEFAYDTAGRLSGDTAISLGASGVVDSTVLRIGTTYDDIGRVEYVTSYSNTAGSAVVNQVKYVYDAWGNVYREYEAHNGAVDANTPYVQYTYADGATGGVAKYVRLSNVTYPDGIHQAGYSYAAGVDNIMSRLSSVDDGTIHSVFASYKYLGAGKFVVENYQRCGGDDEVHYDYSADNFASLDRFGRVIDQFWADYYDTKIDWYSYGYDRAGNRLWKENKLSDDPNLMETPVYLDELYHYDALDRLVSTDRGQLDLSDPENPNITGSPTFSQDWTLDAQGNFAEFDDDGTEQMRTTNAANEIMSINDGDVWIDPTYDDAGNMLTGPKTGEETTRLYYRYDAWNRQVRVQVAGFPLYTTLGAYRYDGLNRRIQKTAGTSYVHYYYNQQWQMLEERKLNYQGVTTESTQHVFSPDYIDSPIIWRHDGNGDGDYSDAGDLQRYYLSDANHNTTAVVDSVTGDVVMRYVYTAYGECTVYTPGWTSQGASTADGFLYCGYWFDAETGNYQVRNRYFTVAIATWMSRDPISYRGGMNLYEYVGDNPLIRTDPTGKQAGAGNITNDQSDYAISKCKCRCAADNPGLALSVLFGSGRQDMINKMYDIQQACNEFATQAIKDLGVANTERNHSALRHCCMSAKIAQLLGAGCAGCLGDAREDYQNSHGQSDAATERQKKNNRMGLLCGVSPNPESCCKNMLDKMTQ